MRNTIAVGAHGNAPNSHGNAPNSHGNAPNPHGNAPNPHNNAPCSSSATVPTFQRERELHQFGYTRIAGVDEAGRGPLAGPVVAAAVVLPPRFKSPGFALLNDSKQLKPEVREQLYLELTAQVEFGVGHVEAPHIDEINIRQASWLAMRHAVADLLSRQAGATIDFVLIDGLPYGAGPWPYEAIVKGDAKSLSIAAASVIAKVTRDRIMEAHHTTYPHYGFRSHKGYGTPQHLRALEQHGPCPLHRMTFAPVAQCGNLQQPANSEPRTQ